MLDLSEGWLSYVREDDWSLRSRQAWFDGGLPYRLNGLVEVQVCSETLLAVVFLYG